MKLNKNHAAAASLTAAIIYACAAFTGPKEGERHHVYRDVTGTPTVCFGETQGVIEGKIYSHQECLNMLMQRIPDYLAPVDRLMPNLPDNRRIAYTDFAYNKGVGALTLRTLDQNKTPIIGTSIVDLERAGNWQAACNRMSEFVYSKHQLIQGLVNRAKAEVEECLKN